MIIPFQKSHVTKLRMVSRIIGILLFLFVSIHLSALNNMNDTIELRKILTQLEETDNFELAQKGLNQAERIQNNAFISAFFYRMAKILENCEKYDSASVYYEKAIPYFVKSEKKQDAAKCYINIGVTHYYYGRYSQAITAYDNALNQLKGSNDTILLSKTYNNLGVIYKSTGYYKKAIENFHHVIQLNKKNTKTVANTYQNLSTLYWEHKNYNAALRYLDVAFDIFTKLNSKVDLAGVYNNYALIYNSNNQNQNVVENYQKAIDLYTELGNKYGIAITLSVKGKFLDKTGNKKETEKVYLKALSLFKEINYDIGIFSTKLNLSKLYSEMNNKALAIEYAKEALDIKNINRPIKYESDGYLMLAQSYSEMNEYENSVKYFKKYVRLQDSVFNLEMNKQIAEVRTRFEIEKAEAKVLISEQTIKLQNLELKHRQRVIIGVYIILAIAVVLAGIFYFLYFQKQKLCLRLVEHNVSIAKSDIAIEQKEPDVDLQTSHYNYSINPDEEISRKMAVEAINNLMLHEKPFKQKQYTINDLAKQLNTNRNFISQIINNYFNTNFNNFINEYRVKEARKLLISKEYDNYSIEGIGELVGFHSKTTFNAAFKKFTGVTPSFFKTNAVKFDLTFSENR